jgi:DNA-binding NarL/FixJ family response regulator
MLGPAPGFPPASRDSTNRPRTVSTAVQDRRRLFREGLGLLLAAHHDIRLVGTVSSTAELAELCDRDEPDVIVFQADGLPDTLAGLVKIRYRHERVRLVGVPCSHASRQMHATIATGGSVLVGAEDGIDAILAAIRGETIATDAGAVTRAAASPPVRLTDRERQVLRLVGAGETSREIACGLGISPKTVENCKQRVFAKLGVHNRAHALAIALSGGLLVPVE